MGERVSPRELRERLSGSRPPMVIDVRGPRESAAGHIPGAVNLPLAKVPQAVKRTDPTTALVTYRNMHHPGASRGERAQALLEVKGFQAAVLEGGLPAWTSEGLPVEAS